MTTDRDALLAAILEAPEDDTLRLIFADWLEEHVTYESVCPECNGYGTVGTLAGTMGCHRCSSDYKQRGTGIIAGNGFAERAEFIRVQIELANTPEKLKYIKASCRYWGRESIKPSQKHMRSCQHCRYQRLVKRERELLSSRNALDWGPDSKLWDNGLDMPIQTIWPDTNQAIPGYLGTQFLRGFVAVIYCRLSDWLTHGESLVREHPIQKVVCTDKEPYPSVNRPGVFFWLRADFSGLETMGDHIPDEIFHYLETKYQHPNQQQQVIIVNSKDAKYYPSQQAALDDLSQALIRWAKSQSAKQSVSRTC